MVTTDRPLVLKIAADLGIPLALQESFCCDSSHKEECNNRLSSWSPKDFPEWVLNLHPLDRLKAIIPSGVWCLDCDLPRGAYTLQASIRECDGCSSYYVPSYKDFPIKYFLCKKCDRPSTKPKKKRTIKVIKYG